MDTGIMPLPTPVGYELRFQSLFNEGRGLAFPCDAEGHVDMDALSEHARGNYLYARAGRPRVRHARSAALPLARSTAARQALVEPAEQLDDLRTEGGDRAKP